MRKGGFGRTTFITKILAGVRVTTTILPKRQNLKEITLVVGLGNPNVPTVVSAKKRSSSIKRLKLTASAQAIPLIRVISA